MQAKNELDQIARQVASYKTTLGKCYLIAQLGTSLTNEQILNMNLGRHLDTQLQLGTLKKFLFSHNKIRYIQIELARYRQAGRDRDGCCRFSLAKSPNLICTLHTAYLVDKVAGWVISSKYLALFNIMVTNLIFCCLTLTGSLVWVGSCAVLILNF